MYCVFPLSLIHISLYALLRFYRRKLDLESSLEVERKQNLNKQELNEERLRFYTNITHELRTPLPTQIAGESPAIFLILANIIKITKSISLCAYPDFVFIGVCKYDIQFVTTQSRCV